MIVHLVSLLNIFSRSHSLLISYIGTSAHEYFFNHINCSTKLSCRSQWPRGLRRRSTAPRPLRFWFRIPLGAWKFVCCECCVLSGRGLCDGLITRPEESYRLWRVVVCDQKTSRMRRLKPATGLWKIQPKGL